jgi:hypothetical protein
MYNFERSGEVKRISMREHVVRITGCPDVASCSGVECENPSAPEGQRIYRKTYTKREILLPNEYDSVKKALSGDNVLIFGMTGYTTLTNKQCADYGVKPGAYEAACADFLAAAIGAVFDTYPDTVVKIVDGAANLGVDSAVLSVAHELKLEHVGFSCPRFLFYVDDIDDGPVFVGVDQEDYSTKFVCSLDILIGANGRDQAMLNDLYGSIRYNKKFIPANILRAISVTGGPPARDANGKILDATAAFYESVTQLHPMESSGELDSYLNLRNSLKVAVRAIARPRLDPSVAYGGWKNAAKKANLEQASGAVQQKELPFKLAGNVS